MSTESIPAAVDTLPSSIMPELPAHRAAILKAIKCHKLTLDILAKGCGPEFARFQSHEFLSQLYRAAGNDAGALQATDDCLGPNVHDVSGLLQTFDLINDYWPELVADHPAIVYVRILQILSDFLPKEKSDRMYKTYLMTDRPLLRVAPRGGAR